MILHWIDIALVVVIAAAGSATIYFLLLHRLQRVFAASHREMEHRLAALAQAINMREPASDEVIPETDVLGSAELEPLPATPVENMQPPFVESRPAAESDAADHDEAHIPTEVQVAITAAAVAAFGNHARVRSARRVPSTDVVSPWTQQGRVIVQSSHNLRIRG